MSNRSKAHTNRNLRGTLIRSGVVMLGMLALTVFAFASKGGGEKKKTTEFDSPFTPINSASSFSLRKAPGMYTGLMNTPGAFHTVAAEPRLSISPLINTYQKGNTTIILPFQYRPQMQLSGNGTRSSLQLFGVKIQMPR